MLASPEGPGTPGGKNLERIKRSRAEVDLVVTPVYELSLAVYEHIHRWRIQRPSAARPVALSTKASCRRHGGTGGGSEALPRR